MNVRAAYAACAALAVFSLGVACSSPDTAARVDAIGPDVKQFDVVAPMLVRRCGSIDCLRLRRSRPAFDIASTISRS